MLQRERKDRKAKTNPEHLNEKIIKTRIRIKKRPNESFIESMSNKWETKRSRNTRGRKKCLFLQKQPRKWQKMSNWKTRVRLKSASRSDSTGFLDRDLASSRRAVTQSVERPRGSSLVQLYLTDVGSNPQRDMSSHIFLITQRQKVVGKNLCNTVCCVEADIRALFGMK